ncbi:CD63 antigen-like [Diorhabda carinulata]|uniref:CD63 antigen-like n=1 Tax=Diorhabda carinulata TaxID=1163345 RepID=UPI0025A26609|nr:CD63 antigen-like [Diorhabda carinulata]XP_057655325.1 CD63 antigen-like [Diorhabda carinulata]
MVSGGMSCIKYLLFAFNLLFAISGIAILTIGTIVHILYTQYSHFLYTGYHFVPLVLIVVGVVIFIIAFFGCCGAVKENHCMIVTFSVFLLIILVLEIVIGVWGYIKKDDVGTMLENQLNDTMPEYYTNPDIKDSWNIVQHEAECCGVKGPKDWPKITHNETLPYTCCPNTPDDGSCKIDSENVYNDSCVDKLKQIFIKYGSIIGGVGLGVAGLQLIGIVFACCLACSIRKEYETV